MAHIKVAHRKPTRVVYIEHHGRYEDIPWQQDIEKLYAFAKSQRLRPGMRPMGIYPDDPLTTEESRRRSRVALPVRGEPRPTDEVLVQDLPAMEVAELKFEGPSTAFRRAYTELADWVRANGFEPAGAPMETYTKKPRVKGSQTLFAARIAMPVRRR